MGGKTSKTIIFLDIDGVLNNEDTVCLSGKTKSIEIHLLHNLKEIIRKTKAEIVISSTWRLDMEKIKELKTIFKKHQISILDYTIDFSKTGQGDRVDEIYYWLEHSNYTINNWIAIDDMTLSAMNNKLTEKHFVHTNIVVGLTINKMNESIKKLNLY